MIHALKMGRGVCALTAAALLAAAGAPASAGIVTYTLSGQLDGAIGGTTLTDTPFTWSLTANNLTLTTLSSSPALQALSASLSLGGLGTATFLQPSYVLQSPDASEFGFLDQAIANGAAWTTPGFAGEVLGAAFAPRDATLEAAIGALATDLGAFKITDATNLTFSAVVTSTPPVLYTLSGAISGTLNGVAFTDDPFTWTVTAATDNAVLYAGVLPALRPIGGGFNLGGFGDLGIGGDFEVALSADNQVAGFVTPTGSEGLALGAPAFSTYVLGDALAATPLDLQVFLPLQTAFGQLKVTGATGLLLTAAPLSAAPEPATWALAIVGFAMMGGALRRRRRPAATLSA
jgi:hypothetical protein